MFKRLWLVLAADLCGHTAKGPVRPVEGGHYGPAFMANIVTGKCVDSMPLYRMEKQLKRAGLNVLRSSLCNLFHQTADALKPIYQRMLDMNARLQLGVGRRNAAAGSSRK